ncbi:MAG: IS1634 family transposase [Candidatus Riflebacteria bacterium]|nr:IS1634 family transposase [Candidatus Riflebacteria bacterium]
MPKSHVPFVATQNLNHLGLVASTIKELGIPEQIDQTLGSEKSQVTKYVKVSECVSAMILNGLGFANQALYMVPNFFENKPLDRLINSGVKAEFLNDDALGRCLDIIAEEDPTKFFANIAFPIGINRKYRRRFARLDSTTFSVEGKYEGFGNSPEEDPQLIEINYGHSKKHRPDLKQIVLSMVSSGDAGFSFWAEPLSGNASDKKSFHETIAKVQEFQKEIGDAEPFYWTADSALYSKTHLLKGSVKFFWISRVPETIKEAQEIVSRPEKAFQWQTLENGYKVSSMESNYGDIPQRWLLVSSQQAYDSEVETMKKQIKKEFEASENDLWHLSNEEFACVPDAMKKFREVVEKFKFHLAANYEIKTEPKFKTSGRPKVDEKPVRTVIRIVSTIKENKKAIAKTKLTKGRFILATNDLNQESLPDDQILREYKGLQKVERGFRFLKDPWFLLDKLYLKTPNRIAALTAIMALCLMVYNVAEYELRRSLKEGNLTLPNQLKKAVTNPTLRWIFQMMDGITIITMKVGRSVQTLVSNITDLRAKIIHLFGKHAEEIYGIH